jgi:hypothetical protein
LPCCSKSWPRAPPAALPQSIAPSTLGDRFAHAPAAASARNRARSAIETRCHHPCTATTIQKSPPQFEVARRIWKP